MIIMTKVDEACPLVKDDLKKVYTSKRVKEKVNHVIHLMCVCALIPGTTMFNFDFV